MSNYGMLAALIVVIRTEKVLKHHSRISVTNFLEDTRIIEKPAARKLCFKVRLIIRFLSGEMLSRGHFLLILPLLVAVL